MIQRVVIIALAIALLAGLIAYSKLQLEPNRVSGFIEADEIRVGSRVGGRVEAVEVAEGARVTKGQTLIRLEPYDLLEREREAIERLAALEAEYQKRVAGLREQEVAQAAARHNQAKANLDKLRAGPRPQEIEAARGQLQVATAVLALARQNYARDSDLFERKAITREEFDKVSQQLEEAQARLVVRQQELSLLEAGTREEEIRAAEAQAEEALKAWELAQAGYREEEIAQAKASRDAAQAALEAIGQQKKELTIISPVDGVIEALDLRQGDLVPAGGPVLSILDDSDLWVRAYVPQNRVGLQVGQQLWVTVDSLGGERVRGEVSFIARQAEFTPNNVQTPEERSKQVFRMKVTLLEATDRLRPGMAVDVWLDPIEESP